MTDWSDCPQADFGYCARIQCLENPPAGGCTVAAYCIPSFFKKEIDLALLGIEKWADDRAYFCTPRKAGIIGRDGVPGALCRHELYRYAGTAGRRYDPCGLRRRGSPQTGALRPGSAEDYFVCSRDRVYRRCGWPGIRFCWRGAGKTSDGLFLASFRLKLSWLNHGQQRQDRL